MIQKAIRDECSVRPPMPVPPVSLCRNPIVGFLIICFRWKFVIALVVVATLATTLLALKQRTSLHAVRTTLLAQPLSNPGGVGTVANADNSALHRPLNPKLVAQLVTSASLLETALETVSTEFALPRPYDEWFEIELTDEGIMSFEVRHPEPMVAESVANALTREFENTANSLQARYLTEQIAWIEQAGADRQESVSLPSSGRAAEHLDGVRQQEAHEDALSATLGANLKSLRDCLDAPRDGLTLLAQSEPRCDAGAPIPRHILWGWMCGTSMFAFLVALVLDQIYKLYQNPASRERMAIVRRNMFSLLPKQ